MAVGVSSPSATQRGDTTVQTTTLEFWDTDGLVPVGAGIELPGILGYSQASPDGSHVMIPDSRGLTLWDLRPRRWVDEACKLAGRSLTRAEWQRYLPNTRYNPTCR